MMIPAYVQTRPCRDRSICAPPRRTTIIHLPDDLVLEDANLINNIIDAVFNHLADTIVELRISVSQMAAPA